MAIKANCNTCGHQFNTTDDKAGAVVICPNCSARFQVPDDGFAAVIHADLAGFEKDRKAGYSSAPAAKSASNPTNIRSEAPTQIAGGRTEVVITGIRLTAWDAMGIIAAFWVANFLLTILGIFILWILLGFDFSMLNSELQ